MLTQQHRQESLSRAYIHAVTGRLGLSCSFANFDYGIDVTVNSGALYKGRPIQTGYPLDIQAKSSTKAVVNDRYVKYDVEAWTYETLRIECRTPRILVLLVLPKEEEAWVEHDEERLLMRKCAYWISLKGEEAYKNSTTVRVEIPRVNLFTVEGLRDIMAKVEQGLDL